MVGPFFMITTAARFTALLKFTPLFNTYIKKYQNQKKVFIMIPLLKNTKFVQIKEL